MSAVGSAPFNLTNADPILKDLYTPEAMKDEVYNKAPLFALLPKSEENGGRQFITPLQYSHTKGISATFATAQANKDSSKQFEDYKVDSVQWYGLADVDGKTIRACNGDLKAFVEAMGSEIKSTLKGVTRKLAQDVYRNGNGGLATIGSGATTATITLAKVEDIVNFEVGMKLVASQTDGGALRDSGATETIKTVDRAAGKLGSTSAAWNTVITALANADTLYRHGDAKNNGTVKNITGLMGWLPQTDPSGGENFFGVDRSVDRTRLAGLVSDATGKTIQEALIDAAMFVAREGGSPDVVFMNWGDMGRLIKELGTQVQRDIVRSPDRQHIGFKSLVVQYPGGEFNVVPDHNCPMSRAFMLSMESWKLRCMGPTLGILDHDGLVVLRNTNADGVEVRVGGYGNLTCNAPGYNLHLYNLGA